MQNVARRVRFGFVGLALAVTTGYLASGLTMDNSVSMPRAASSPFINTASAQTVVKSEPDIWEYSSTSVDAVSIQPKLTTLGMDGWEVFAVTAADAVVDTGADGKMHISTQRFEVTSKRKRAR